MDQRLTQVFGLWHPLRQANPRLVFLLQGIEPILTDLHQTQVGIVHFVHR